MLRNATVAMLALWLLAAITNATVPPQITVQGKLTDAAGVPLVAGDKSFSFKIYSDQVGGSQAWPNCCAGEAQTIATDGEGLWTANLGAVIPLFSGLFNDTTRWLEITVDGTTLPRVRLVTGPYSFRVGSVQGALGGDITSKVSIGSAHTNSGTGGFVTGDSNSVTGARATVTGGTQNWAGGVHSFVGGGGSNSATGPYSTIIGAYDGAATGTQSAVVGGGYNEASGDQAVIAGGTGNVAVGGRSFIAGGTTNDALGYGSVILGGNTNRTTGSSSVAAGFMAQADHDFSMVFNARNSGPVSSSTDQQFLVSAMQFDIYHDGGNSHFGWGANDDTYLSYSNQGFLQIRRYNGNGTYTDCINVASNSYVGLRGVSNPTNVLTLQNAANANGQALAYAWATYSSRRFKDEITPLTDALFLVSRLQGVRYRNRSDSTRSIGLIAEDVGTVVPEVVTYEENGVDARSIDYARLVAVLIEAVKEQQKQIDDLRAKLEQ